MSRCWSRTIYVGKLPGDIREREVEDLFYKLDLICATKGTLDWVQKLKWEGLKNFTGSPRPLLYCKGEKEAGTQAFVRSYKNMKFYWILGAGHMVPMDNPCTALEMLGDITHSPAAQ